jgi:hypothetical protein
VLFDETPSVELDFQGEVIFWKGPSPYHFVAIPDAECEDIAGISSLVTYGWGVVPVQATVGTRTWTTSLFPRHGRYLLPLRDDVRKPEGIEIGERVTVRLVIQLEPPNAAAS